MEVTSAIVPFSRTSTRGLSHLQAWQNLKRVSNCVRNTMNFDSLLKLVSLKKTLKITIYFNYFSDSLWLIGCQLLSHNILSVIKLCVHILIFMFSHFFWNVSYALYLHLLSGLCTYLLCCGYASSSVSVSVDSSGISSS